MSYGDTQNISLWVSSSNLERSRKELIWRRIEAIWSQVSRLVTHALESSKLTLNLFIVASGVAWIICLDIRFSQSNHCSPGTLLAYLWWWRVGILFERRESTLCSVRYNVQNWEVGESRIGTSPVHWTCRSVQFLVASCSLHRRKAPPCLIWHC